MTLVADAVLKDHVVQPSPSGALTCSCEDHGLERSPAELARHVAEAAVALTTTSAGAAVLRVRDHPRASWRKDMEIRIPASATEQELAESMVLIAFAQSAARLVDADGMPHDLLPVAT